MRTTAIAVGILLAVPGVLLAGAAALVMAPGVALVWAAARRAS